MSRYWVYNRMKSDPTYDALMVGGIHPSTALNIAPHIQPFTMYRQTSDVDYMRGDDGDAIRQCGYWIFVHDLPGDYLRIDAAVTLLQGLFKDTIDQPNGIVRCHWNQTSDDQRDEDMGTIFKYVSIQVLYKA